MHIKLFDTFDTYIPPLRIVSTNLSMNILSLDQISCDISGSKVFYYPIKLTRATFVSTPKYGATSIRFHSHRDYFSQYLDYSPLQLNASVGSL